MPFAFTSGPLVSFVVVADADTIVVADAGAVLVADGDDVNPRKLLIVLARLMFGRQIGLNGSNIATQIPPKVPTTVKISQNTVKCCCLSRSLYKLSTFCSYFYKFLTIRIRAGIRDLPIRGYLPKKIDRYPRIHGSGPLR